MNNPALLSLRQAHYTCQAHYNALREALDDLHLRNLTDHDLECLSKDDRRLLDQFAYRYTRLQDDMGARLIPAALLAMGEEIAAMPVLDRLDRLEQLGWLPSAEEWGELRRTRNEFTHDYPETAKERYERLQLAHAAAEKVMGILEVMNQKIQQRFP
jgi:hypothetical protein